MADETPNPPPPAVAPPSSDDNLTLAAAVAADKEEESQSPPPEPAPAPAPAAAVTVTVTESESTAKEEEEKGPLSQPPPVKEELLPPQPPPPAAAVEVKTTSTEEQEVVSAAAVAVAVATVESEKPTKQIPHSVVSFKEESNLLSDLSDSERKALQELRQLVQEALDTKQFTQKQEVQGEENKEEQQEGEISIWGIPLLKDDRSDVILLKFLRARDFKVRDSLLMIKNTIKWRKQFGIDALVAEDLGDEWDKVVFMHGYDRDGHSVCYNVYGEFQNKELYAKAFADEEKRGNFLKWRIQFLEKGIRKLDFYPHGVSTLFQVNDLKNSPGPGKRELRLATKQALQLLQDNYPEFVAKQV